MAVDVEDLCNEFSGGVCGAISLLVTREDLSVILGTYVVLYKSTTEIDNDVVIRRVFKRGLRDCGVHFSDPIQVVANATA